MGIRWYCVFPAHWRQHLPISSLCEYRLRHVCTCGVSAEYVRPSGILIKKGRSSQRYLCGHSCNIDIQKNEIS
jgi:hypothetical protein